LIVIAIASLIDVRQSFVPMSAQGHFRPNWPVSAMSGLPPLATELRTSLVVRLVPTTDSCNAAFSTRFAAMLEQGCPDVGY